MLHILQPSYCQYFCLTTTKVLGYKILGEVDHANKYVAIFLFQLSVWKNDILQCQFSMVEEIRDFSVADNLMYTVRDRDVCINELMPGGYFYVQIGLHLLQHTVVLDVQCFRGTCCLHL